MYQHFTNIKNKEELFIEAGCIDTFASKMCEIMKGKGLDIYKHDYYRAIYDGRKIEGDAIVISTLNPDDYSKRFNICVMIARNKEEYMALPSGVTHQVDGYNLLYSTFDDDEMESIAKIINEHSD